MLHKKAKNDLLRQERQGRGHQYCLWRCTLNNDLRLFLGWTSTYEQYVLEGMKMVSDKGTISVAFEAANPHGDYLSQGWWAFWKHSHNLSVTYTHDSILRGCILCWCTQTHSLIFLAPDDFSNSRNLSTCYLLPVLWFLARWIFKSATFIIGGLEFYFRKDLLLNQCFETKSTMKKAAARTDIHPLQVQQAQIFNHSNTLCNAQISSCFCFKCIKYQSPFVFVLLLSEDERKRFMVWQKRCENIWSNTKFSFSYWLFTLLGFSMSGISNSSLHFIEGCWFTSCFPNLLFQV